MENRITTLKSKLIKHGVRKLRLFGFIHVDESNILTDEVYKVYFTKILRSNSGRNNEIDFAIEELLKNIHSGK